VLCQGKANGAYLMTKGGEMMKKLISLVLLTMLAISLTACAGMKKGETTRVKCPACGYEFDAPAKN
jgi:hypothetical protein